MQPFLLQVVVEDETVLPIQDARAVDDSLPSNTYQVHQASSLGERGALCDGAREVGSSC